MSFRTRCLAVNVRDLESSTSDFSSIDDTVITETKRKASSIDKGLDLVAFYSDHHSLPTFQGLDKYYSVLPYFLVPNSFPACICHEIDRVVIIDLLELSILAVGV